MKTLITLTTSLVVVSAMALGAQSSTTATKTKVEVKGGKEVKVTGCIEADSGGGYALTHVADKGGALHSYMLVSDSDDLGKVVGQRVQIEGKIADSDNGKVEVKSKSEAAGKDTHTTVEGRGPYLGVKHMKKIAASCP